MIKKASAIVLLLSICAFSIKAQSSFSPKDEGDIAYKSGDYVNAITNYERIKSSFPNDNILWYNLAESYFHTNDMSAAVKCFEHSQKITSPDARTLYFYALSLMGVEKYKEAIRVFEKLKISNEEVAEQYIRKCSYAIGSKGNRSVFKVKELQELNHYNYDDFAPFMHQGALHFTSYRPFGPHEGNNFMSYLFNSYRGSNGTYTKAIVFPSDENSNRTQNLVPISINEQKNITAFTFTNSFRNGLRHTNGVSLRDLSLRIANYSPDFTLSNEVELKPFGTASVSISFPYLSTTGDTLYFSADKGDGNRYDLYMMMSQNGKWGPPIHLGNEINTKGNEVCPFIDKEGSLYFSSDYLTGFGGFDIFVALKADKDWKSIHNLGPQVNSSKDDMYFSFDSGKKQACFASNKHKKLHFNLYEASLTGELVQLDKVKEIEFPVLETQPIIVNNSTSLPPFKASDNQLNKGRTTSPQTSNSGATGTLKNTTTSQANTRTSEQKTETATASKNNDLKPCATNFYIGGIVDKETSLPIDGVSVYYQNLGTGEVGRLKKLSNLYGEYSVLLNPLSDYKLILSKVGYKNLHFIVNTGAGNKKMLLRQREMIVSSIASRDAYGNVEGDAISSVEKISNVAAVVTNTKDLNYKPWYKEAVLPKQGYRIQVMTVSRLTESERKELTKFGYITEVKKGNLKAIRIGIYVDKTHLEVTLKEIQKKYKDAFKVKVDLSGVEMSRKLTALRTVVLPKETIKETTSNTVEFPVKKKAPVEAVPVKEGVMDEWATSVENNLNQTSVKPVAQVVRFKIQLGAFKSTEGLSFSKLASLGSVEQILKNGLTYFYLASYKTLEEARQARTKAKDKGIVGAFIVAFKNGKQVKISEAVK